MLAISITCCWSLNVGVFVFCVKVFGLLGPLWSVYFGSKECFWAFPYGLVVHALV